MQIDICIPTLHRLKKLQNCINSIDKARKNYAIFLYIYFSDIKEFEYFNNNKYYWMICRYIEYYRVPEFWNNHLQQMNSDALIYLNDDVLLYEDFFDIIYKEFNDLDSIMGINQINIAKEYALDSAYGIIGKDYTLRFPNKQVWCSDYYRFYADRELGDFAKSINKFKFCEQAKITHLHPNFTGEQPDETHKLVRQYLSTDRITYQIRKSNNFLWGRNFNLLYNKKE